MMKTSVIIPVYNEEKGLPKVIEDCIGRVDEVTVVDDGSTDNTLSVAKRYNFNGFRISTHGKNRGKVEAIRTGIGHATGDIIVLMDGDYTYPARYIKEFVREIEGGADLVLGNRFGGLSKNIPLLNRIGNRFLSLLAGYISCVNIQDGQTGYRAFKRKLFVDLDVDARSLEYETKMTIQAAKRGYKIKEIPIEYRERIGKSKLRPLRDGFLMFWSIVRVLISETTPISKVMLLPSIVLGIIGSYLGLSAVVTRVVSGSKLVNVYYPLVSVLCLVVAVQFFSLGIMMDYFSKKLDRIDDKVG